MFSITPHTATAHLQNHDSKAWKNCRVIGVDTSRDAPAYIVEIRAPDGTFYLERADCIRKPAPTAGM